MGWINTKLSPYRKRNFLCGNKTIFWLSYLKSGILDSGKTKTNNRSRSQGDFSIADEKIFGQEGVHKGWYKSINHIPVLRSTFIWDTNTNRLWSANTIVFNIYDLQLLMQFPRCWCIMAVIDMGISTVHNRYHGCSCQAILTNHTITSVIP